MDNKFANGISVKEVGKYGDIKLSIKADKLLCDENKFNEDGWGNFIIRKAKSGKYYCIVDEWKPAQKQEGKDIVEFKEVSNDSLPF